MLDESIAHNIQFTSPRFAALNVPSPNSERGMRGEVKPYIPHDVRHFPYWDLPGDRYATLTAGNVGRFDDRHCLIGIID